MNLPKQRKNLCTEKHKVWIKQMKDDTNGMSDILFFGLEESIL